MRRKIYFIIVLFSFVLVGCSEKNDAIKGNGSVKQIFYNVETIQYNLKVNRINFEENFVPKLSVSFATNPQTTKVFVKTDENILDLIDVNVDDNKITISSKTDAVIEVALFEISLTCNIKDVEVNGNYEIDLEPGRSQCSNIILNGNYTGKISSGGSVYTATNIEIIGNGNLDLALRCYLDNFKCVYNGNVKMIAPNVLKNAVLYFNGYSEFTGRITESLNVFINGEGYISYDDDYIPTKIVTNINGFGEIKEVNL